MAVSAVTAENLRNTGATDIRQLNQVAPSLLVSSTSSEGGAAVARIRGIGTVGDNPGLEGSVGLFIDGVYRSRAGVGLTELGPLDRIEVLRGPQGTLFGRNTSAGLISIITAKPRFTPEVSGQVDVGNFNMRRVEASITGPISDTIAARLDGVYLKRDGFLKDVISGRRINDRDRWLLRGQVLFQPSDNLSLPDHRRLFQAQRGMLRRDLPAGARRHGCRAAAVDHRGDRTRARRRHQRRHLLAADGDHARPRLSIRTSRITASRAS